MDRRSKYRIYRYIWNVLIALDHLINAILMGDPFETLSSRAARMRHKPHWRIVCLVLDTIDPGHSEKAIPNSEKRFRVWALRKKKPP